MDANTTQQTRDDYRTIDLMEVFFTLLNAWRSILLVGLIGAVLAGAYHTFMVSPSYRATSELYITNTESVISLQELQIGSALTEDYKSIIKSRAVLNDVISRLHLNTNYKSLGKLITVTNPSGTHILQISVTTSDLELSRDIANALLVVSIDRIYQIVGSSEPTVIDYSQAEAVENVTPGIKRYVLIGALAGMLLVMLLIFFRMAMNTTIKNDEDVEIQLQMPVLAAVPYFKEKE